MPDLENKYTILEKFLNKNTSFNSIAISTFIVSDSTRHFKVHTISRESKELTAFTKKFIEEKKSILQPFNFFHSYSDKEENNYNAVKKIDDVIDDVINAENAFNFNIKDNFNKETINDFDNVKPVINFEQLKNWRNAIRNPNTINKDFTKPFGNDVLLYSEIVKSDLSNQRVLIVVFLVSKTVMSVQVKKKTNTNLSELLKNHNNYFVLQAFDNYEKELLEKQKQLITQTQKSAKTAIMARNMSHNLGSHVLSYLKEALKNVKNILTEDVLDNLIEKLKDKDDLLAFETNELKNVKLPFLVGLGRFISYLQERQDFIATIATDYIPPFSTVNFKDFIFDEINADLKHYRHDKSEHHINKNMLLEYIAYSEGYTRNDIQINFRGYNGLNDVDNDKSNELGWQKPLKNEAEKTQLKSDIKDLKEKYNIELPGGFLGRQAIFSILENIIRNSCKHRPKNTPKKLKLVFDLTEITDQTFDSYNDLYEKEYNNKINYLKKIFTAKNYYIMSITDKFPPKKGGKFIEDKLNDKIKDKLNGKIKEKLIDETKMTLNPENKGMKELAISAFWLIGEEYEEDYRPIWYSTDEGCLKLNFLVRKSKRLCIITNATKDENKDTILTAKEFDKDKDFDENKDTILTPKKFIATPPKELYYKIYVIDEKLAKNKVDESDKKSKIYLKLVKEKESDKEPKINYLELVKEKAKESGCRVIVKDLTIKINYIEIYTDVIKQTFKFNIDELPSFKVEDKNTDVKDISFAKKDEYNNEIYDLNKNNNNPKILYKAHYDQKDQLDNTGDYDFVESITGHNSSNRWQRNVTKNEEWVLRSVESALMKVCIIDERIFDRLSDKSENKSFEGVDELIDELEKDYSNENIDNLISVIGTTKYDAIFTFLRKKKFTEVKRTLKSSKKYKEKLSNQFLIKKGIYVFDINGDKIIDPNGTEVGKIDSKNRIVAPDGTEFGKIDVESKIVFYDDKLSFNFVFIHQGLLDKLLNKGEGIQHSFKDATNKDATNKDATNMLRLIVHSGRSKPDNLVDNVAFLPYSLLSTVLEDTKLSLIDICMNTQIEPEPNQK